jgi:predicted O-linked N-acetylglucosamine transferase (SPINDLY family)
MATGSPADYERVALSLARDKSALAALKAKLARNRSTCALFDTACFTHNLEQAFETMVDRYRRGEPPRSFFVGAQA